MRDMNLCWTNGAKGECWANGLSENKVNKENILQTDKVQRPCWQVGQRFLRKHLDGLGSGWSASACGAIFTDQNAMRASLMGLNDIVQRALM